jgi:SNF2 family DNA or RNA helicase
MPRRSSKTGSELFIVDNSDTDWKVVKYLHDWCQIAKSIDIATGYFEIGSLLALQDEWQKVDKIRILMGDEVSKRTKRAFEQGLQEITARLDDSIEKEKEKNDFLTGVPAIVEAIRSGKIECRVYKKDKFHAKAYITHARMEAVGSFALVGSSNFTYPGLTENIELNVQITGGPVNVLQEWYEEHWKTAEDVTPEILKTIDRHIQEYSPFEIYAKALQEFFRGHEQTATEWELNESKIYPILAQYQKEGYHGLLKRSSNHGGAFLCDGVGLGKTFVGLMLIERLVMHDRLNVALFVPKSARVPVWEQKLKKYLPHIFGKYSKLEIFNHTDLLAPRHQEDLESVRERADVIIIDEAHHFRNRGTKGEDPEERQSRYWRMFDVAEGKQVYMLTATPVNNKLRDLQHMIELFSRQQIDYFKDAPLGVHSLPGHFRQLEKALEGIIQRRDGDSDMVDINMVDADDVLEMDNLFGALVVQRSRAYVKRSCEQEGGGEVPFPEPKEPKIIPYSVKQTYGKLLTMIEDAFHKEKPLFSLAIYYPYAYYKGDDESIDPLAQGRQKQVVSLIRIGFLKRFESSAEAFKMSCWALLRKLLAWVEVHAETGIERSLIERWKLQHAKLISYVREHQHELFGDGSELDAEEDIISEEMKEAVKKLPRDDFKVDEIISETILDLDQIATFLKELENFKPSQDKKLTALLKLLKKDTILQKHKLLIFSEFKDTARYLRNQLEAEGISGIEQIDSASSSDRGDVIRRFSPYYNESSSRELKENGEKEIRVLISTDILSEGLNLQDATRLINYDLHWNPVRLMQRIGRVDRRMDPKIEEMILADHPDQEKLRGTIQYWNILPPEELDGLLKLYHTVSKKTLRISKTFGIEGKKLLTPEDNFDALKDFTDSYEGTLSNTEEMHLELQALFKNDPDLEGRLNRLPLKVFSGKEHPKANTKAVFFCYSLPAKEQTASESDEEKWSLEAGTTQWYLYDLATGKILTEPTEIISLIRSQPDTPRKCAIEQQTLTDIRTKLDKHVKNTYLKKVQAPVGVHASLKAWMELN